MYMYIGGKDLFTNVKCHWVRFSHVMPDCVNGSVCMCTYWVKIEFVKLELLFVMAIISTNNTIDIAFVYTTFIMS